MYKSAEDVARIRRKEFFKKCTYSEYGGWNCNNVRMKVACDKTPEGKWECGYPTTPAELKESYDACEVMSDGQWVCDDNLLQTDCKPIFDDMAQLGYGCFINELEYEVPISSCNIIFNIVSEERVYGNNIRYDKPISDQGPDVRIFNHQLSKPKRLVVNAERLLSEWNNIPDTRMADWVKKGEYDDGTVLYGVNDYDDVNMYHEYQGSYFSEMLRHYLHRMYKNSDKDINVDVKQVVRFLGNLEDTALAGDIHGRIFTTVYELLRDDPETNFQTYFYNNRDDSMRYHIMQLPERHNYKRILRKYKEIGLDASEIRPDTKAIYVVDDIIMNKHPPQVRVYNAQTDTTFEPEYVDQDFKSMEQNIKYFETYGPYFEEYGPYHRLIVLKLIKKYMSTRHNRTTDYKWFIDMLNAYWVCSVYKKSLTVLNNKIVLHGTVLGKGTQENSSTVVLGTDKLKSEMLSMLTSGTGVAMTRQHQHILDKHMDCFNDISVKAMYEYISHYDDVKLWIMANPKHGKLIQVGDSSSPINSNAEYPSEDKLLAQSTDRLPVWISNHLVHLKTAGDRSLGFKQALYMLYLLNTPGIFTEITYTDMGVGKSSYVYSGDATNRRYKVVFKTLDNEYNFTDNKTIESVLANHVLDMIPRDDATFNSPEPTNNDQPPPPGRRTPRPLILDPPSSDESDDDDMVPM